MEPYFKNSKPDAATVRNAPKKLYEECFPRCFPQGATEYTDSMMQCAMNCKSKLSQSFLSFKETYRERLEDDGYVIDGDSYQNNQNPFLGMKSNPRMLNVKKNFKVEMAPASSNYV
ncbi:unnamed protein product [Moneuplotes crassus]|uniref:Uncharacterized protein n=1 Tax=Euplotes crassus TaxID=5936 RepID=A0AAD1XZQ8_EUPCR|nr:unnamed protein product [Moneuplotes crassus]